ncbi:MAG: pyridoxamine 5'-phosphate oxidase family protein [Dehalococcoidia bacterium]|nr:pyridoxamine 5'-phosphate oxidase family protein [Dehalococcoidia bacterium]
MHPRIELSDAEEAEVRARAQAFIAQPQVTTVITIGLDGRPRWRVMGGRATGFVWDAISIKPSSKILELERDPRVTVVWLRYDVREPGIDQPLRMVGIDGVAELVHDGAAIRAMAGAMFPRHLDDATIAQTRVGIRVHPTTIRVEGFLPGPRYPVFLRP